MKISPKTIAVLLVTVWLLGFDWKSTPSLAISPVTNEISSTVDTVPIVKNQDLLSMSGQAPSWPECGAIPSPEAIAIMDSLQPLVDQFTVEFMTKSGTMQMVAIPIKAHIIRMSNGSGGLSISEWNSALNLLNSIYAAANLQFVECGAPNIINSDQFYNMTQSQESQLHGAHGVANVLNVYIPGGTLTSSSGSSLCGYAWFPWQNQPDLTVIKASCMTNGNTFAHEVGHYLGLYHTHGVGNCPPPITDELVNGSNCNTAGDRVCDTPADPGLSGLNCQNLLVNTNCQYTGNQTDANGQLFAPNPRNIMAYTRQSCRDFFSTGQLARAYWYRVNARTNLVCSTPGGSNLCSTAINISCGQSIPGTTTGASQSVPDCGGQFNTAAGIWYRYTASQSGLVTLSTCNSTTNFDTKIAVYSGSCTSLSCLAGNDDDSNCTSNGGFSSTVQFNATTGQTYYIYVTGYESATGTFQLSLNCNAANCPTPTGLQISDIGFTTFTVNWNAVSGATAYEIQLREGTTGTWNNIGGNPFGQSPINVTGATAGTAYQCRVRAICGSSNSPYTNEVSFTTLTTNAICANATTITCDQTLTGTTNGSAQQVQFCGTSLNSAPGLWYRYTASQTGQVVVTTCNSSTTFDTKIGVFSGSCTNLVCVDGNDDSNDTGCQLLNEDRFSKVTFSATSGQTYLIYVTGFGSAAGTFQLSLNCIAAPTCSAPTTSEFSHSNVTSSSAQLSTTATGNQFQFRYKPSSSSTWTTTAESSSTVANISSLSANTAYDYQVRRRCTNNVWSDWSVTRTFTTVAPTCSAPTTSEFSHSNVTSSSAQLSTTAAGNQFQFRYKPSSSSTWTTTAESSSTVANISSLSANTAYDYQVRRRCTNNVWSDWSATRTFTTDSAATCSAPTTAEFGHSNVTSSSAQLSTTAAGNQFQFRYKPSSGSTWTTTAESASTGANISSLSANTAYDYQVRRRCTNNLWSDWSATRTFTTDSAAACSAPTTAEFDHSNVTSSSSQLSTTAAGNQFQFRYKPSSGSTWTTTAESASTGANISSLSANTAYDYQVRRRCINNIWSDWSATRTFTTNALSSIPWTRIMTGTNHTIIALTTLTATLDGTPLVPGDAIGFFFEHNGALHCSNYLELTNQAQSVAVYMNDANAPNKNGFATGETFKVKIYKASTQQVHDAQVNFAPAGTVIQSLTITHTNTFAANGVSLLTNLNASTNTSFRIVLNSGWNMISSHTLPADANMPAVFSNLTATVEVVKDINGNAYIPGLNINGIGNWVMTKGYQVRSAADTALTITGMQVDPSATPVAIVAGWQIIPYLRTQAAPINQQLAGIAGIIELVKDNLGINTYIPGLMINSIGDMRPGQGYQLKASASGTLTYTPNQLWSNPPEVQHVANVWERALPVHFPYEGIEKSAHNSTLVIRSEVAATLMEPGDEIGVFTTSGILCGAAVFEDRHFAVTIWGDDPSSPGVREGLWQGEVFQLRIWKRAQNSELSIAPVFTSGDQVYHNDDIEILAQMNAATAVKESMVKQHALTVFPNPTDGRFYVMLPSGIDMLELRDAKGALLQRTELPSAGLLPIETVGYAKGLLIVSAWDATGRRWFAKVVVQ